MLGHTHRVKIGLNLAKTRPDDQGIVPTHQGAFLTCVFLLNNGKSDQLVVTLPETWQRLTKPQQQKTLNQASDCGSMQWCSRLWGKFCKHGQSNRGSRLSRMPYPAGQIQAKVKCPTRISRLNQCTAKFCRLCHKQEAGTRSRRPPTISMCDWSFVAPGQATHPWCPR